MKRKPDLPTTYIIDTYKRVDTGTYCAGAITFKGRKKMDVLRWEEKFPTQALANAFVRSQFRGSGLSEAGNEGELIGSKPLWSLRIQL